MLRLLVRLEGVKPHAWLVDGSGFWCSPLKVSLVKAIFHGRENVLCRVARGFEADLRSGAIDRAFFPRLARRIRGIGVFRDVNETLRRLCTATAFFEGVCTTKMAIFHSQSFGEARTKLRSEFAQSERFSEVCTTKWRVLTALFFFCGKWAKYEEANLSKQAVFFRGLNDDKGKSAQPERFLRARTTRRMP